MSANRFFDAAAARAFARAGNARITLVSVKTGTRFTYRIQAPSEETEKGGVRLKLNEDIRFVSVLTGPDNGKDYRYFGFIRRGMFFHGAGKARISCDAPSVKAFAWAWQGLACDQIDSRLEIWHEGCCGRCGRPLTVPESIASGFGPECIGRI